MGCPRKITDNCHFSMPIFVSSQIPSTLTYEIPTVEWGGGRHTLISRRKIPFYEKSGGEIRGEKSLHKFAIGSAEKRLLLPFFPHKRTLKRKKYPVKDWPSERKTQPWPSFTMEEDMRSPFLKEKPRRKRDLLLKMSFSQAPHSHSQTHARNKRFLFSFFLSNPATRVRRVNEEAFFSVSTDITYSSFPSFFAFSLFFFVPLPSSPPTMLPPMLPMWRIKPPSKNSHWNPLKKTLNKKIKSVVD